MVSYSSPIMRLEDSFRGKSTLDPRDRKCRTLRFTGTNFRMKPCARTVYLGKIGIAPDDMVGSGRDRVVDLLKYHKQQE